jgi:hypothetical protein
MKRRRSIATALALTLGSAAAAYIIKRRNDGPHPHVGLYFEDGSMVSLPDTAPQAAPLLELGRDALALVRGA